MSAPTIAPPSNLFDLGTEALNGRDGDTARAAGTKYNTHQHQTSATQDALDGSATPSASNVFATIADVSAGGTSYEGGYDASTNTPDLDTSPSGVTKGDMYTVTVAGTFFTVAVEAGDLLIAEIDTATVEADWTIVNRNIDAATTTVAGIVELATDGEVASLVVVQGNDCRLSDSRAPTTHATSHTDGSDDIQDSSVSQKGLMSSSHFNKLDGVEESATADQTGAEIKSAYEGEADTNAFTDAEQTKLSGIETAADVTDAANVVPALDTATLDTATVSGTDKVLIKDTDDSDGLKSVTAQSIADLATTFSVGSASVTTTSIAGSGNQALNITGLTGSNILISAISVERTAGTSTSVSISTYTNDTHASLIQGLFGEEFAGVTVNPGPVYGPYVGISTPLRQAVPYVDEDTSGEIHIKVFNEDVTNAGTWQIKVKYLDLGAF